MIGALILGVLAGFLGRALLPGKQDLSVLMTIVLGLAGAALGWLFFTKLLGIGDDDAFDLLGLPGAVIGAMVLLFVYDRFIERRAAPAAPSGVPTAAGEAPRERGRERPQRGAGETRTREQREADAARRQERRNR